MPLPPQKGCVKRFKVGEKVSMRGLSDRRFLYTADKHAQTVALSLQRTLSHMQCMHYASVNARLLRCIFIRAISGHACACACVYAYDLYVGIKLTSLCRCSSMLVPCVCGALQPGCTELGTFLLLRAWHLV
jgi:hypothetical protein